MTSAGKENKEVKVPVTNKEHQQHADDNKDPPALVVICGGGIVGLCLALALHKQGITNIEIYEKCRAFHSNVGAGMGMYPNGLRVLRDIDVALVEKIREAGHAYLYRKWSRHDGTEIMISEESVLARNEQTGESDGMLESIGIRRWDLQRVLFQAVQAKNIPIYFGKRTVDVIEHGNSGNIVEVQFADGTRRRTQILFACDGGRSAVRQVVVTKDAPTDEQQQQSSSSSSSPQLQYTGVTCMMGLAAAPPDERGITFPSSLTTQCHAVFFPTSENEQCFQIHYPIAQDEADPGNWGTLTQEMGKQECHELAQKLRHDGWHERYLTPLEEVTRAVKIGFCLLEPKLTQWVYGRQGRIVLVGDAAHPPVPYTGQGAQQGLEDCGTLAMLLKHYCLDENTKKFTLTNFRSAMKIYEKIRIPRVKKICEASCSYGEMQQKRAECEKYDQVASEKIQRQVFFKETLPVLIPGATYDYKKALLEILEQEAEHLPVVAEE